MVRSDPEALDQPGECGDRLEAVRQELLVSQLDLELSLDKLDELENPHRIDDATVEQRLLVGDSAAGHREPVANEHAEAVADVASALGRQHTGADSGIVYPLAGTQRYEGLAVETGLRDRDLGWPVLPACVICARLGGIRCLATGGGLGASPLPLRQADGARAPSRWPFKAVNATRAEEGGHP